MSRSARHARACAARSAVRALAVCVSAVAALVCAQDALGPGWAHSALFRPEPSPRPITAGPDGNLWFTEASARRDRPSHAQGSGQHLPVAHAAGVGGITAGPEGALWFTVTGRTPTRSGASRRAEPSASTRCHGECLPGRDHRGSDGNLWFTEGAANAIARMTPGGAVTEFPLPTAAARADQRLRRRRAGLSGSPRVPDGNVWFTQRTANKIGRITPSGAITEFPLPVGDDAYRDHGGPGRRHLVLHRRPSAPRSGGSPRPADQRVPHPHVGTASRTGSPGSRRRPVVHRGGGQHDRADDPERQDQPVSRSPHRRPADGITATPTATSGSPKKTPNAIGAVNPAT